MILLLGSLASASDWPTARGPVEGTFASSGAGDITGTTGGYPYYAWSTSYSTTSYTTGYSVVLDADGDGAPETIGVTKARVALWDGDGSVLAVSDTMANPYIHGLYDLDGDGLAQELVVVGSGVGGGVFVYDATTLARLWRSEDPGLNGGGAVAETAVVDTDGDGIPELLWTTSFTGFADYRMLSFAFGFGDPTEVTFTLPSTSLGLLPVVEGAYYGAPGAFAVEQGTALTFFETADRTDADATCSDDETRCLRLVGQYTGLHQSYSWGDRISVDVDGDGDTEYLSTSSNDLNAVDIVLLDPSAGTTTDDAVLWQYRYGNGNGVPISQFVYASENPGLTSSAGGEAVVATVFGDTDTETDSAYAATDDCVNAPGDYAVIAFDGPTGTPLASLTGTRAYGTIDGDGDGVDEIVTWDEDTSEVAGWELVCEGPGNTGAWSSCSDTGCSLQQAWTLSGDLPLLLPQQIPAQSWHLVEASAPAVVDLTGDARPEVLVTEATESGTDLVAWDVQADGSATEVGRHTLGTCTSVGGWTGEGTNTWILLEGTGCHEVLDATLTPLTSATLADDNQGVGLALVGDVGHPVVAIANRIYTDPSSGAAMASPTEFLSDSPTRFADLDGDGVDELITYAQGSTTWRIVVYEWTGLAYSEKWRKTSTQLGGDNRAISVTWAPYEFSTGDYDGDGDTDIAFLALDPTRGGTAFSDHGTLFFVDGATGDLVGAQTAPAIGVSATYSEPMQSADLCAGTFCPGADGKDEVVLIGGNSVTIYSATDGYLQGWSVDASSESMWGDFDGDGEPEIALLAGFSQTDGYRVQLMELDGTLDWEAIPGSASGSPYTMHAAADIDDDGALDILVGGGYGELYAYSGRDGSLFAGFPIYLDGGSGYTEMHDGMRRVLQLAMVDVDGDGHVEAMVGHDDAWLYAVNVATAEGTPSVEWSTYLASPLWSVRAIDADDDGTMELLLLANDGKARLLDGGDVFVEIAEPIDASCTSDGMLELSGTAGDAEEVEIYLQGVSQGRVPVTDGEWSTTLAWPGEGEFRVEVWAVVDDELLATDTILVSYFDDADGDGVSECDGECDDTDPDRYPGAEEECDGIDSDCDGAISDEADDDGDGFLACEECDDADAASFPEGEEECDGIDNDCDGEVDEGVNCELESYLRGGGGCDCDTTGSTAPVGLLAGLGLLVAGRRRR